MYWLRGELARAMFWLQFPSSPSPRCSTMPVNRELCVWLCVWVCVRVCLPGGLFAHLRIILHKSTSTVATTKTPDVSKFISEINNYVSTNTDECVLRMRRMYINRSDSYWHVCCHSVHVLHAHKPTHPKPFGIWFAHGADWPDLTDLQLFGTYELFKITSVVFSA